MEKIEKGTIIEVKIPNVEKPIKAVVLDIISTYTYEEILTILFTIHIFYMHRKGSLKCLMSINME